MEENLFFGQKSKNPQVQASSSAFCSAAVQRLKAGPDNIPTILAANANYTDALFTGKNMIYWENDYLTTPGYSYQLSNINSGYYIFQDWTKYLKNTTDLFYANGTINHEQYNQGGLGNCYFVAAAAAVAEFPSLLRSVFLTQNKNDAGIFAVRVFLRHKPYVIVVDDNIMFNKYGNPVYGSQSDDKTAAWGMVLEKVWSKVLGNYLKSEGGYTVNGFRFLTGNPVFSYSLTNTTDLPTAFTLLNAADNANYIMGASTGSGLDSTKNICDIANGHAYSILAAFNMTDGTGKVHSVYMIRNPWGQQSTYNQTWKATDSNWTASLVAQVPLGVDPRNSEGRDGVMIVRMEDFFKCFTYYQIGHIRDSQGFVRTWYDNDKDDGLQKTYTFSPGTVNDAVYISVENYPYQVVPEKCHDNNIGPIVQLRVTHNGILYEKYFYDDMSYWFSIPVSSQLATSPFTISILYFWYGSPSNEYTVVVYSKHVSKTITRSTGQSIMYNMDGSGPSGFTNSTFCGMNCTSYNPCLAVFSYTPVVQSFSTLLQMSGSATETKTASQLFTLPSTTCDFNTCSIVDSSGNSCPQASLSKTSTQLFTVTRLSTTIQTSQQCRIKCTLSDGSTVVETSLFNVFVDYACNATNSYTTTPVSAISLLQNSGYLNQSNKLIGYSELINYKTGFFCAISNCKLYSYTSNTCQWNQTNLSESWINQTSGFTLLQTLINTSISQTETEFCVQCTNNRSQPMQLTNRIKIGVTCTARTATTISYINTGFSQSYSQTGAPILMGLAISNYFTNPTGACPYTQCSIVDASGNTISWLTGAVLYGNTCTFNVTRSATKTQTNFYLKLTSTAASPLTVTSNVITIKVTDDCSDSSYINNVTQSFAALKQTSGSVTVTKTPSQLFILPLTTCDLNSCSMVDQSGAACPQASITKTSTMLFTVTRLSTTIQSSYCRFKCTLSDNSTTVQSAIFNVDVNTGCTTATSSQTPVSAISLLQNDGTSNKATLELSYSSMIKYTTTSFCVVSQTCKLYSYAQNTCQWNQTSLSESWVTQTSDVSQINAVIDTSTPHTATEFCVQCTNSISQTISLTNKITIGVGCTAKTATTIAATNTGFSQNKNSGISDVYSMGVDLTNYFYSQTGVCNYTECSIVDVSGSPISWLTGGWVYGNTCYFNVATSATKTQTNFYLKLTSTTASPLTVTSQAITIQVTDPCLDISKYTPEFQYFSTLYQMNGTATETMKAYNLFRMPSSTCDFSICSMVDSSGNSCPQVSISKASTQTFTVTRLTTTIQTSQLCKIKCTPTGQSSTIETTLFSVNVESDCTSKSAYTETALPVINVLQHSGAWNQITRTIAYTQLITYQNGYSCGIQDCELRSYASKTCNWYYHTLAETWITSSSNSSALTVNIDTSIIPAATEFCVKCFNNQGQEIKLTNRVVFALSCVAINEIRASLSDSEYQLKVKDGRDNYYRMHLNLATYFNLTTGACIYTQCDLLDTNGNSFQYAFQVDISGNTCSFDVYTGVTLEPIYFKVRLTSAAASPKTVDSNFIQIRIVQGPQATDWSKVKIVSLQDIFAKATDMESFFTLIWNNLWCLFIWF